MIFSRYLFLILTDVWPEGRSLQFYPGYMVTKPQYIPYILFTAKHIHFYSGIYGGYSRFALTLKCRI